MGRQRINHLLALPAEVIRFPSGCTRLQVALNDGIGSLILETDALSIWQELSSKESFARIEGGFIDELKSLV